MSLQITLPEHFLAFIMRGECAHMKKPGTDGRSMDVILENLMDTVATQKSRATYEDLERVNREANQLLQFSDWVKEVRPESEYESYRFSSSKDFLKRDVMKLYHAFKDSKCDLFSKNCTKKIGSGLTHLETLGRKLVKEKILDPLELSDSNHLYSVVLKRKYPKLPCFKSPRNAIKCDRISISPEKASLLAHKIAFSEEKQVNLQQTTLTCLTTHVNLFIPFIDKRKNDCLEVFFNLHYQRLFFPTKHI